MSLWARGQHERTGCLHQGNQSDWIQLWSAICGWCVWVALNFSNFCVGVSKLRVVLGRLLSLSITTSISLCWTLARYFFLAKYCLIRPLVFSLSPHCQCECWIHPFEVFPYERDFSNYYTISCTSRLSPFHFFLIYIINFSIYNRLVNIHHRVHIVGQRMASSSDHQKLNFYHTNIRNWSPLEVAKISKVTPTFRL